MAMRLVASIGLDGKVTVPEEKCIFCKRQRPDGEEGWIQRHAIRGGLPYPTGEICCPLPECQAKAKK